MENSPLKSLWKFKTSSANLQENLFFNGKLKNLLRESIENLKWAINREITKFFFIKAGTLLTDLQEWYRSTNNIDPMIQLLFSSNTENIDQIYRDQNYWPLVNIKN